MEGDLTSQMGTYSPEAGIIPRTLYRLFYTLEMSKDEYSVHASFIELYNEELRDLLSDESPQPLGGGRDSAGLRIYEDKGKGVMIQGLEDVPMRDAAHGLRLLRKGSQKRQIAATHCNESSSRSHCVFTLTIHIKETTQKGEDVLRTGKLNLVDLAGSENIRRSGAENKRAREAGMINQSLLTLGRVINALVEKSSHVPYRESKLTRLLQESLGGRTKTCIIATVSSERRNMEETLSTLDYALRAKSIRNKPEVNQRMTRAALIKEYVSEIERLKGDLLASREKNGIFLSPESWQAMQDEHDDTRIQVEELRRHGEVVESKMVSLKEQFEQNMQLLVKREAEAKSMRSECEGKEQELQQILRRIEELQQAETEERSLRQAYMRSEKRLDGVARNLRDLFQESTADMGGLFAKLDRKTKVERKNRDVLAECQASLASLSNQMEARVSDFGSSHEQFTLDLSAQLREFQMREQEKLRANREAVEQKLQAMQTLTKTVNDEHKQAKASIDSLADAIRQESDILVASSQERNETLHAACQSLVQQVAQGHRESLGAVRAGMEEMGEMVISVLRMARERSTADRKTLEDVRTSSSEALQRELGRLKGQNDRLSSLLVEEREKSASMRDSLTKNIAQMITTFCQQREQSFAGAIDEVRQGNANAQDDMQTFTHQHSDHLDELLDANQAMRETLKENERTAKAQRIRSEAGLNQSSAAIERQMHEFTGRFISNQEEGVEQTASALRTIAGHVDGIRDVSDASRNAEAEHLGELRGQIDEGFTEVAGDLQSTLEDVEETCEGAIEGIEEHRVFGSAFLQETNSQLSSIRSTSKDYLSSRIHVDMPTGATPQKKDWPSVASWPLVQGTVKSSRPTVLDAEGTMSSMNGNLVEMAGQDEGLQSDEELREAQIRPTGTTDLLSSAAAPPRPNKLAQPSTAPLRPSLPAPIPNGGAYPLTERPLNRFSMAHPPRIGQGGSKLRPPTTSHAPGALKRARQ